MIGIKIIAFFTYSLFITSSKSIDLILPLSEEDASKFSIHKRFLMLQYLTDNNCIYHMTSYESLPNDLIRRVVYHGEELINDNEEHPEDFRRFVLVGLMRDRVLVAIANHQSDVISYQPSFSITEEVIVNHIQSPGIVESIINGNPTSSMGAFLSTIYNRRENTKKREYDELDSVDDEPYLLRGSSDISAKKIKEEVEAIIGNENSTPNDLSAPGGSGITKRSSVRKEEKKDETAAEDSD